MTNNPNGFTIENSALVLIDHQPGVALAVHSIDHRLVLNNAVYPAPSPLIGTVVPPSDGVDRSARPAFRD